MRILILLLTSYAVLRHASLALPTSDEGDLQLDGVDQTNMIIHGGKANRNELVYLIELSSNPFFGAAAIRDEDFKLIWGYEGITDGYGRDVHYRHDPNWEKVQHPSETADPVLDIISPYHAFYASNIWDLIREGIANSTVDFHDFSSGPVHLYYLPDDSAEKHNLAMLPVFAERVQNMKTRVLELSTQWRARPREPKREAEARAAMVDGTWITGFCEDLDLLLL